MQDKDILNGVNGKYSDCAEKDINTNANAMENAKVSTVQAPSGLGYRHLQVALLFGGLLFAYSLRVNISVGIVAMVDKTANSTQPIYSWDEKQQNVILSSFFWGYLIAQIPVSRLAQRYGPKILLTIASLTCAVLTLITPWAASIDWKLLLITRALQGLFQGFYYPCVHTLLAKWVHPCERGTLTTITYSGTQAGSVIMLAISGFLASSTMGWPSIFYFSGAATAGWTILWVIFGSNSPAACAFISDEEKRFIESMPGSSNRQLHAPWSKILSSIPVIALIIVHSTQCWGFWTLLTETPSYLKQIFDFDIKTNALLTALPYLAMWLISLGVSPISDYLINRGCISTRTGRKLFNSIGHWIPAMTLVILPYMTEPKSAIFLLTIAVGLNGSTYVGYMVNHMDLSPNFAGSLMGLTNSLANIMSVLGPLTVGYILTPNHDIDVKIEEWKMVFFIAAGFYFTGNLLFLIFGEAEIQPWNEPNDEHSCTSVTTDDDDEKIGTNVSTTTMSSSSQPIK